jgi:hypothetical protein
MLKRSRFSDITDTVLMFAVSLFFGCVVTGYFSRETAVILAAGLACAFSVTALAAVLKDRRKPDIGKQEYEETWLQFFAGGEDFGFDTVLSALTKRYQEAARARGAIVCGKTGVYLHLKPERLTVSRLFTCYADAKAAGYQKLVVLTAAGAESDAARTAKLLPEPSAAVLNGEETYRILRKLDGLPPVKFKLKKDKTGVKQFFLRAVSPVCTKRYLLTALFLVGSSFLLPQPVYYMAAAAVCLVLTLLSKIDLAGKITAKKVK